MVKTLVAALALAAVASAPAQARDVYWSVNVQAPLYPSYPTYPMGAVSATWSNVRPVPVYVQPVVMPQPVLVMPAPVVYRPVVYRPVVVQPAPYPMVVYRHPYRHHKGHWKKARHHHRDHHDDDDD
jgi:hypothetical protein